MKKIVTAVAITVFAASTAFAGTVYKAANGTTITLPDSHPKMNAPEKFKGKDDAHGFCFKCHGPDKPKAKKCGECHKKDKK